MSVNAVRQRLFPLKVSNLHAHWVPCATTAPAARGLDFRRGDRPAACSTCETTEVSIVLVDIGQPLFSYHGGGCLQ